MFIASPLVAWPWWGWAQTLMSKLTSWSLILAPATGMSSNPSTCEISWREDGGCARVAQGNHCSLHPSLESEAYSAYLYILSCFIAIVCGVYCGILCCTTVHREGMYCCTIVTYCVCFSSFGLVCNAVVRFQILACFLALWIVICVISVLVPFQMLVLVPVS